MSRPLRIEYEGAWYHVMNRGSGRQKVFRSKQHYELFLQLLLEVNRRFQVEIHAYCLMPNHYHLLIKTPLPNLSSAMRHLNSLYTRRFNVSCQRDGPLFRGRFKSILVDSDNYLLRLSRYIHLNPVKAGLVKTPQDFNWSSYPCYLNPKNTPEWLSCDETLSRFSNRLRRKQYELFVNEGIDKELDTYYQKIQRIPILGTKAFSKTITDKYLKNRKMDTEINEHRHVLKAQRLGVEQIFQITADFYQIPLEHLKTIHPNKKNIPRSIGIYLAMQDAQVSLKEVATFLGNLSYSAVAKSYARFRDYIGHAPETARHLEAIRDTIERAVSNVKT